MSARLPSERLSTDPDIARAREIYAQRRADGLCVRCGQPARDGRVSCQRCHEQRNVTTCRQGGPRQTTEPQGGQSKPVYEPPPRRTVAVRPPGLGGQLVEFEIVWDGR